MSVKDYLFSGLRSYGFDARMVSIQRLQELEEEIEGHHQEFAPEFYQERITRLQFNIPPVEMPQAKSIIIVAMPSMQAGAILDWNGETKTFIVPPTYPGYYELPEKVERDISELLVTTGYRVVKTMRIPLKLLAVRSGLAEYGRNNITYVPGMGSFHHLFALYSDIPCEEDEWREPTTMERCQNCRACIIKCPTGAIGEDRFLIHAEKCLVFHNEKPGDVPFPEWIDPTSHNSLIGCMICQRYCPEDRKVKDRMEILAKFSYEETSLLLHASTPDLLPVATLEKLKLLGLADSPDVLPRNLGVLLNPKHDVD